MGDPAFRSVEHPFITFLARGAFHAHGIAAGVGFGKRPCAQPFAGGQFRQPFRLLFIAAELQDVAGAKAVVRRYAEAYAAADPRHFNNGGDVFEITEASSSVLFWNEHTQHAGRTEMLLEEIDRQMLLFIPIHHMRAQFPFAQITYGLRDHRLVLGGSEFHFS